MHARLDRGAVRLLTRTGLNWETLPQKLPGPVEAPDKPRFGHGVALSGLGYRSISGVRQGKYFEIALDAGATREQAQKDIDTIARDVLTNPVIEEYRIEFLD